MKLTQDALDHLDKLPLGNAIKNYIEQRKSVHGDFLTSIVEGDLFKASRHADNTNRVLIAEYALFFAYYAPVDSYGSLEKKLAWLGINPNYEDEPAEQERLQMEQENRDVSYEQLRGEQFDDKLALYRNEH